MRNEPVTIRLPRRDGFYCDRCVRCGMARRGFSSFPCAGPPLISTAPSESPRSRALHGGGRNLPRFRPSPILTLCWRAAKARTMKRYKGMKYGPPGSTRRSTGCAKPDDWPRKGDRNPARQHFDTHAAGNDVGHGRPARRTNTPWRSSNGTGHLRRHLGETLLGMYGFALGWVHGMLVRVQPATNLVGRSGRSRAETAPPGADVFRRGYTGPFEEVRLCRDVEDTDLNTAPSAGNGRRGYDGGRRWSTGRKCLTARAGAYLARRRGLHDG